MTEIETIFSFLALAIGGYCVGYVLGKYWALK